MRTIKNESELPVPDGYRSHQQFLRSKTDPDVLIEYHDGQCYRRADGEYWMHPAYKRDCSYDVIDGQRSEPRWSALVPASAYCDAVIYDKKQKAAA